MRLAEILTIVFCGAGGSLVVYGLQRLERRNTEQHASNMAVLTGIRDSVGEVRDDVREVRTEVRDVRGDVRAVREQVVRHLEWHADQQG